MITKKVFVVHENQEQGSSQDYKSCHKVCTPYILLFFRCW